MKNNNKKTKILILGASGFIGRNMLEKFTSKSNYEVHATYFSSKIQTNFLKKNVFANES